MRYKQTVLGIAWAVLQPLMTMAIFTVIFGMFVKMPSDGLPYPLFALVALLPWTYFAEALSRSSVSLVGDAQLIRKVYFPRLIMPLAAVVSPAVDFLPGLHPPPRDDGLVWRQPHLGHRACCLASCSSGWSPRWRLASGSRRSTSATAMSGTPIPFLTQCWMYASPVAYPVSVVPEGWRTLYALNPMVGVIEGFRWALLGQASPDVGVMLVSLLAVIGLLVGGLLFFHRMEQTFADVI